VARLMAGGGGRRGGDTGGGPWWSKYILLATIPALLIAGSLFAPQLLPSASDSVIETTVVQGAGGSGIAQPARPVAPQAIEELRIEDKPFDEWLNEQVQKLAARLESETEAKISKALDGIAVQPKPKSRKLENSDDLEQQAKDKVEKAMGSIEAKIKANLNLDKRVSSRVESKFNDQFDKDLDNKLSSSADALGLKVIVPGSPAAAAAAAAAVAAAAALSPGEQIAAMAQKQAEAPSPAAAPAPPEPEERPIFLKFDPPPRHSRPDKSDAKVAPLTSVSASEILEKPATSCKSTSVEVAPKEWCGRSLDGPLSHCHTAAEKTYLQKHQAELEVGLKALRAPGCFTHGVSIATMGYFRTGSTLLYNYVRLWAVLATGQSLVSGFGCKSPVAMGIGVAGKPQEHCTVVCKDHDWKSGVAKAATVVISSRRDPWESVCSRKLQSLWCRIRQKGRKTQASAEEKQEYQKECLRNKTVQALEAQYQCKDLMTQQANVYLGRREHGLPIVYDVLMSDYKTSGEVQVSNIAKAMGICKEAYEDPELIKFLISIGDQLHDNQGADQGVTQMHGVHSDEQRQESCSKLRDWMRQDEQCREWMDGDASADSNGILRSMEEEAARKKKNKR